MEKLIFFLKGEYKPGDLVFHHNGIGIDNHSPNLIIKKISGTIDDVTTLYYKCYNPQYGEFILYHDEIDESY